LKRQIVAETLVPGENPGFARRCARLALAPR
jgi:hypothetical protein